MVYETITRLCKQREISITELERTLNFGNGTIHNWNAHTPTVTKLRAVADFFGVTIDELVE